MNPRNYLPRWITPLLQNAIESHPVVVLSGARQVGKSTLLTMAEPFRGWRYLSLDDLDIQRQAADAPDELWAGTDRVVLDEVQKVPELLSAVKLAVDRSQRSIKFALSGSSNLLLMKNVSESLAGRAVYFDLQPLALGEISHRPPPSLIKSIIAGNWPEEGSLTTESPDVIEMLLRGFMPRLISLHSQAVWRRWWDGYVTTYLERDLRQLSLIKNLPEFRRLMELTSLRTGQLLNKSELARDARLKQPTAHRYLNLLETTKLFEQLPSFTLNRTSRLTKSPKPFWTDPALPVFLAGYLDRSSLQGARELGAFFENLVFHHLRVLASLMVPPAHLFYWRTRTDKEVHFIFEHGRKILAIEVKLSANAGFGDVKNLRFFLEEYPEAVGGLLLYNGREIRRLGERIIAVPWTMVAG